MADWLYEAGIGERRAALIEHGRIIEALIELDEPGLRLGAVEPVRLIERIAGGRALARSETGFDLHLAAVPPRTAQGESINARIVREAIPEQGRVKLARGIPAGDTPAPAPRLYDRLTATGHPVRELAAHEPDALEDAGWSELLDEAMDGRIDFPGGALLMSPTPAMTLFDVDGGLEPEPLAIAGARAVGQAVRRQGIGGSIGIDFPTLQGKAARQSVAAALDETLLPPFERTAVNGFGFLQIIRPRTRASLPERLRTDPVGAAARATLRTIERTPPGQTAPHRLPAAIHAFLDARPALLAELARRTGTALLLEST